MIVTPAHKTWLDKHLDSLFDFGKGAKTFGGFGYLDENGKVDVAEGIQTYINCRMTHIYSLYVFENDLALIDDKTKEKSKVARQLATHGVQALIEHIQDKKHGGFFEAINQVTDYDNSTGKENIRLEPKENTYTKVAYVHAFVMLAVTSGILGKIDRAEELFKNIENIEEKYFWDSSCNKTIEAYSTDWLDCEKYRGINAAMHTVEAYLQTHSMLNLYPHISNINWLDRAEHLVKFACKVARENKYMLPEHFDENWGCLYDYNIDDKAHQFRPYGATIGHSMEWCRLGVQLVLALYKTTGEFCESSLQILSDCVGLFNVALQNWGFDGNKGFAYTTDFEGNPIVSDRLHWVLCEAIGATVAFREQVKKVLQDKRIDISFMNCDFGVEGNNRFSFETLAPVKLGCIDLYDYWYLEFIKFAEEFLITSDGKWNHQLDKNNVFATNIWHGRPDIYHAYQALWFAKNQTIFLGKDM